MPTPDDGTPPEATPPPEYEVAGTYPSESAGSEHGLVVLSMRLPYWLEPASDGFRLYVETGHISRVRTELAKYDRESLGWPPRPPVDDAAGRRIGWGWTALWALALVVVFQLQLDGPRWLEEMGTLDTIEVFGRWQLWRPVTALFLHANTVHVAANIFGSLLVFPFVFALFGHRRGLLWLMLASVGGNFLSAAVRGPGYRSIGASTAVFAGIGLLAGRAVAVAGRMKGWARWRMLAIPLGAGLSLLALLGSGEFPTDIVAHATGFGCGMLAGLLGTGSRQHL
jgi:membrane associated rhomboid family serine protease